MCGGVRRRKVVPLAETDILQKYDVFSEKMEVGGIGNKVM